MITLIDKANNFQIAKVRLLRQILLFLQNNSSPIKKLLTVLPRSCFAVTKLLHVIVSAYPSEIENHYKVSSQKKNNNETSPLIKSHDPSVK